MKYLMESMNSQNSTEINLKQIPNVLQERSTQKTIDQRESQNNLYLKQKRRDKPISSQILSSLKKTKVSIITKLSFVFNKYYQIEE